MKKLISAVLLLILAAAFVFYAIQNMPGEPVKVKNSGEYVIPDTLKYTIHRTYPHDTSSFTQGLIIYRGRLYEGTGEYGRSKLLEVNLDNGNMVRELNLDKKYFGEGITILNDTIYQLTWQNKEVLVYSLKDFKKIKEFPINTEGWGITTDGKNLIVSDGSSNLYFYEPSSFRLLRTQGVTDAGALAYNMNELEYIDGYIYANQWQLPYIYKINPSNGQVTGKINLNEVWDKIKLKDRQADVPNGIAYDSAEKKMYITGKLWPELYEVQLQ